LNEDFKDLLALLTAYGAHALAVHSREDLLWNRRETGRTRDLADLEALGEKQ